MGGWRYMVGVTVGVPLALVASALAVSAGSAAGSAPTVAPVVTPFVAGSVCLADTRPERLDTLFDTEPGGVVGADYQRALALDDGRVLWTFQDAAIRLGADDITIVHNIGVMQDGRCFTVLYRGSRSAPEPLLFADRTVPYRRWFWPLDAEVDRDGLVHVFTAEMEERGPEYLSVTVPVATWVAVVDPATAQVVEEVRAPDASPDLYGWSITSDRSWTYLYAHCYRQFGFDQYASVAAFDASCAADITVARVPRGELRATPRYWDGARWQPDPARASPIIERSGRRVNADQFEWTGAGFVSVNKEGDWWGHRIHLSRSRSATGPFEVYDELDAPTKCTPDCNSFFAAWVAGRAAARDDDTFVISLSHNRWDGVVTARYRPTFLRVEAPTHLPARGVFEMEAPDGAAAVAITVTAVDPDAPGFVTVYPCDGGLPLASNLNLHAEPAVANLVVVRPDDDGNICLYSMSPVDLVVDLAWSFPTTDVARPRDRPVRLADTRDGLGGTIGPVRGGSALRIAVPVSSDGAAALLNVAAVDPLEPGFLTAYGCDRGRPPTSNVNVGTAPAVSNLVAVSPDDDGDLCIHTHAAAHIVVDLIGELTVDTEVTRRPRRLLDTRETGGRLGAGQVIAVPVTAASVGTEPAGAGGSASLLNVISVDADGPGFVTVFPCGAPRPFASNLNMAVAPIVANLVLAGASEDGTTCVYSSTGTDVVVDLIAAIDVSGASVGPPRRLVDTRNGTGVPGQFGTSPAPGVS